MALKQKQLYWILHIGGWFGFNLINYFIDANFKFNIYSFIFEVPVITLILIFVLHQYKKFFLRKFVFKNLTATFLLIIGQSFIVFILFLAALLLIVFIISVAIALISPSFIKTIELGASNYYKWDFFVIGFLNYFFTITIWVTLYLLFKSYTQMQNLMKEKIENEKLLKEAQLENLSRQLNPHFLFNALSSIKSLVISNPEKSRVAITQLSDMLRYSLNYEKQNFVPLENEIDTIKDYLELEQMRFGDKLKYTLDIDHSFLQTPIPPIILQGMVENAVKHGVAEKIDGGSIEVKVFKKDEQLCLQVNNSGSLIDKERAGIGLKNTQQRLSLLYGDKAAFRLEDFDGFVIAQIKIPLHHEHN